MPEKSYHHGDLKAELIKEGLLILDKEGYEGFSLRKVAKACDVSQTAPYRHFKNKNELIQAISWEALREFNNCLEKAVENNPEDPHRQLNEMGVAYIRFFVENPEYFRLLFLSDYRGKINVDFKSQAEYMTNENPFYTFQKTVERVYASIPNPPLSLEEMTLSCWGLAHGISLLISHQDFKTDKDYLTLVQRIFRM